MLSRIRIMMMSSLALLGIISSIQGPSKDSARAEGDAWSFEKLSRQAQERAQHPFEPSPPLPAELRKLDYDSYRLIAFEPGAAIWKNSRSPFALEFFHRGYLFGDKVAVNLVEKGISHSLAFDRHMFQYRGRLSNMSVPDDLGFAGFRVLGRFESSVNLLEIASFLGASYFRAIAEGQVYGTSARGLAIDVGMPKAEEFPVFREFWIERPQAEARQLRFWALMDSPSLAGAYQFELHPGPDTIMEVKARLYFRRQPDRIGLAPMTSMWMWGDGENPPKNDHRPRVHDCDGLLVCTNDGEWIWRPLSRQKYPSVSHFDFAGIRGFGLMQRDRRPASFRDDEAKYHLRPSVWIEPKRGWSDGAVELLELPSDHEGIDNIAAWWKRNQRIEVGSPVDLEYRVAFMASEPKEPVAKATAMRVRRPDGQPVSLEIDFAGDRLAGLPADTKIACNVQAQRGEAGNKVCRKQPDGHWRITFDVHPAGKEPVELSASLLKDGEALTETWRYLCRN